MLKQGAGLLQVVLGKWKRTDLEGREPHYEELFWSVILVAFLFLILSFWFNSEQKAQIEGYRESLRQLEAKGSALQGDISDLNQSITVLQTERTLPHPSIGDRDAHAVGTHLDVSWDDASNTTHPSYVINLVMVQKPRVLSGEQSNESFQLMLASDSIHRTSRIPAPFSKSLPPGNYVWRVAAISPGFPLLTSQGQQRLLTVTGSPIDAEIGLLGRWSNYGSFTLYHDLTQRIVETGIVRVGVNLEQNSRFSREEAGDVVGYDVTLVRSLIEQCLVRDEKHGAIVYKADLCRAYDSHYPIDKCTVAVTRLCVQFVGVERWGDWRAALKAKEIDLFVGGLTAAEQREGDGIKFLHGYLSYNTRLFVNRADAHPFESLSAWNSRDRTIGVIDSTSNLLLLDDIIQELCPLREHTGVGPAGCKLRERLYRSFPEMDKAMDAGDIDGILVDETLVSGNEWIPLEAISRSNPVAWNRYGRDFLGYRPPEHLAFAAAVDQEQPDDQPLVHELNRALQSRALDSLLVTIKNCLTNADSSGEDHKDSSLCAF